MNSFDLYCATCGAANIHTTNTCFACGHDLSQLPEEDEKIASPSQQTLLNKRYHILSQIGHGGFAEVYKAEDTSDAKIVVIKAIGLKALTPQEVIDATDTYNREIHFGTTLKHSSLPQIYDYFMDQDHWYIVAEFIEGQTLEEYMLHQPAKRLPLQEVLSIGIQACGVLSYLHKHQPPIIFRDVKPDNIMRTASGHIYLIDFGIARRSRPGQRRDTQTLGSPGYAAPEQYGSAQTTERSDIYSLGATLRALLTGKNPLDIPVATMEDDLTAGIPVPPEFTTLLAGMLAKDPAQRYQNIEAVKQQLAYIMKYSASLLQDAKQSGTQPKQFQPVAPSPSPAFLSSAGRASASTPRYHTWQKKLVISLVVLLVLGGGIGAGGSFISSLHQNLLIYHNGYNLRPPLKAPANKQVFTIALNSPGIKTLDPAAAVDTPSIQAARMLYSGLVEPAHYSYGDREKPQLAVSWQQSTDGRTWTFELPPNLRFSDGTPLTSADIAYSFDRALDPAVNSPTASSCLQSIMDADKRMSGKIPTLIGDSILTPGPFTVIIRTATRADFFLSALTCPSALVVEKSLVSRYGLHFVDHLSEGGSSGPFKLYRRTAAGGMELVANTDYYESAPQLTKVSFVVYKSGSLAYNAYLADQVTQVDVPPEDLASASTRSDFHAVVQPLIDYYAMNYLVKPFDNVKIRQAFALALDKGIIANAVGSDMLSVTNHIIPYGQPGYNLELMGLDGGNPYNIAERATQLLQQGMQEEGISNIGQFPTVTFTYASISSTTEDEVMTAQQWWQNVLGVKVRLQRLSAVDLLNKEAATVNNPHSLQFWRQEHMADYPDPQDWTSLQFGQGSALNTVNYGQNRSNTAKEQQNVQKQLQMADSMPDQGKRMQAYQSAEQQLVNDVAWLPMYQVARHYLLSLDVGEYMMNAPLNIIPAYEWLEIYIKQSNPG